MATLNDAPHLLDAGEIAARLGVTEEHTRRMLRRGEIPALKLGRAWRVSATDFARWVESRTKGGDLK
jgi:excisionase family DNA binding protein